MTVGLAEYRLSCELRGHEDDVRGICICGDAGIATSSRDRTIKFWCLDPETKNKYTLSKTLVGHSSFVGPLAWIAPDENFLEGRIVSGGMDTLVLLWDLRTGQPIQTMKGHRLQVTGIAIDDDGSIASSSMDCTVRRWREGQTIESWEAHKSAIQAILKLPTGELVTGSSDGTLKLWKGKTCLQTFSGHTDTVRGLAALATLGILSASHDGSIRLWALTGQLLMEMVGHGSLVFSVDAHFSGLIASGSEDCFAKIWKDGVCVQSIKHPGCVWDVKFLENGDIVTACSDGIVRIWTTDNKRIGESHLLEAYASLLAEYECSRKQVGGLKLMDLPGLDALEIPGSHDGQTKVIREGDNGVAYSWNSRDQKWDKIGEVVDGPDDNMNRTLLDGIHYDYVFNVDIGDGEPVRKLPYNRSDDPYNTADKWLLKENLPLSYRQQVVEFILQNSGQKDFALDTSYRDPYTGSSAYVPGETSNLSASNLVKRQAFKHLPKKGMLFFDVAQFDGILKKISEFNGTLLSEEQNNLSLTDQELSRLSAIVKIIKDTSHYHCTTFADVDISLLVKILKSWPPAMIFPVIDILRMMVLHPDGASLTVKVIDGGNDVLLEGFKKVTIEPTLPANLLTITRLLTNLFKNSSFHRWLHLHRSEILDGLSCCCSSSNKNVNLSYSTLLLNYAVLLIEKKDQEGQAQVLSAALDIAEGNQDVDTKFRALVVIGSLMLEGLVKGIAIDFDVQSTAKAAKTSKEAKIAEVGADIERLINSS